jgi:putative nucleotidyltransferase with HDIG domain
MSEGTSLLDRVKHLVERENFALPVLSQAYFRLQDLMTNPSLDIAEVESLIMRDQSLAAEVLRAANSAFFGGLSEITTIRKAVMRIGLQQVTHLVVMMSERSKYRVRDAVLVPVAQAMWQHASASALATEWLARRLNRRNHEEAFLAGLLHDIGEVVLLRALDEFKATEGRDFALSRELVEEVLSSAHAELGGNFLAQRRIPEIYCRIARDHHAPTCEPGDAIMAIVRLADLAVRKLGLSLHPDTSLMLATTLEAANLGADEITVAELEIMLEDYSRAPV